MTHASYDPSTHYDRVTDAWSLLLGGDLHYGVFGTGSEDLATATRELTRLMVDAARIEPDIDVLDVGCGTGTSTCYVAAAYGARVIGITTSAVGVDRARSRAATEGVNRLVSFELRDGMHNGFPDASFDRVWALESSHLMRDRERLLAECARVLRRGGRLALCDIVLRRPMPFEEVRRLRRPFNLLRKVFGDARMEPISLYATLAQANGLVVDGQLDLTAATRPTFERWRENAISHREEVVASLGEDDWKCFVEACDVLAGFWDDGTLGYALLAASRL